MNDVLHTVRPAGDHARATTAIRLRPFDDVTFLPREG
jgi:hypothetical protein